MSIEQWNMLARETLAKSQSDTTPTDPAASSIDLLRRTPVPQQSPEQLAKINAAAAAFYDAWNSGRSIIQ
jgi:hypothetical protein